MISKVGPGGWLEQWPKVISEDDWRRQKVIVVEDDSLRRIIVSDFLCSEGFQVLEVATARLAFLLFRSVPDLGLVIADTGALGALKDDALVRMPVPSYLRHCGYRVA